MKVAHIHQYGPPEVLVRGIAPAPEPAAGQILIRVAAIGVNPADYKWRMGMFQERVPVTFPYVPGYDVAGRVEAVGEGVTDFSRGDRVLAMLDTGRGGAYAELAVVDASAAGRIPDALDDENAAAIPTASLTGQQIVDKAIDLQPGQILALTGAVGRVALWAAKRRGGKVVAAVRASQRAKAQALGADATLILGEEDWNGPAFDHFVDTVGGPDVGRLAMHLSPHGLFRLSSTTPFPLEGLPVAPIYYPVQPDGRGLSDLAQAVAAAQIEMPVAKVLPLSEAAEAHRLMEAGGAGGKIILKP